jgi:hypothetical protein
MLQHERSPMGFAGRIQLDWPPSAGLDIERVLQVVDKHTGDRVTLVRFFLQAPVIGVRSR